MAEIRDSALLLRAIPFSDSSLILHLLTAHHGRISLMARGARRLKSPFRAGLMPLHQLQLRWKTPRTGNMGTLIEVQRLSPLLADNMLLAGQTLLATASNLFPESVAQGYQELHIACQLLSQRPEASGCCAATWHMLEASGWVGDFEHCWHCMKELPLKLDTYWRQGHFLCQDCAAQQGFHLSSGFRKSIAAHLQHAYIRLHADQVRLWEMMIKDVFKLHHIKH